MTIKGLLFDKDGTLLDYHLTWTPLNKLAALQVANGNEELADRMLVYAGQDPQTDQVRPGSQLAQGTTAEIAAAFAHVHPDHGQENLPLFIDKIFQSIKAHQLAPVAGLTEVIDAFVGRQMKMGLVTADSEQGARISLAPFDILPHFDFVCGYDSGPKPKPDPAPVHAFGRKIGLKMSEIAVIGDNSHDMVMGKAAAAGLLVGVLTGTSGHDELNDLADVVLDSITDLESYLLDRQLME